MCVTFQRVCHQEIKINFFWVSVQFSASDFDYLEACDNKQSKVDRNSLLLRFDPLLKQPVPDNHHIKTNQIVEESDQELTQEQPDSNSFRNPFETSIEETQSPPEFEHQLNEVTPDTNKQEKEEVTQEQKSEDTKLPASDETMSITFANNNVLKDVTTFEDGLKSEIKIMRCVLHIYNSHIWHYVYSRFIYRFLSRFIHVTRD